MHTGYVRAPWYRHCHYHRPRWGSAFRQCLFLLASIGAAPASWASSAATNHTECVVSESVLYQCIISLCWLFLRPMSTGTYRQLWVQDCWCVVLLLLLLWDRNGKTQAVTTHAVSPLSSAKSSPIHYSNTGVALMLSNIADNVCDALYSHGK